MTLVPIIYTSLLIFSALLLFVIIVSYISFKAKGRNGKSFEIKSQAKPNHVQMKHAHINIPSKLNAGYRAAPVVQQRTTQIQYTYKHVPSSSAQHGKQNANNIDQMHSFKNSGQKANRLTRDERLSIVNAPINYNTQHIQQNPQQQRIASHRLPDLNILNYYSDKSGSEFITLSA